MVERVDKFENGYIGERTSTITTMATTAATNTTTTTTHTTTVRVR